MELHVVRPGDTLYKLATQYGVPMAQLINDNQLPDPSHLVVGQSIVIQFPRNTHKVKQGETLSSIAALHETTVRQLLRNNPVLHGEENIYPGQVLVIDYRQEKEDTLTVNSYAYPNIDPKLLRQTLPYLSELTPFTYGFTPEGALVGLDDEALIQAAQELGARPVMHLSTLTQEGGFSNELGRIALSNPAVQDKLVAQILNTIHDKGYQGLDIDFEYISGMDAEPYAKLVARLRSLLSPKGILVTVALAPKISDDQSGRLYEGHNYYLLAEAADYVLLMTYEWGYVESPPMAVAPLPNVRRVVEYALTRIPPQKILLGVPNYGYDWPLPYRRGNRATSISNQYAVTLAWNNHAAIRYDQSAQSPWFRYTDSAGREHEVWFEDPRSIRAKLALCTEYGLRGVGIWNLMRPAPQNWAVLNGLYNIREE